MPSLLTRLEDYQPSARAAYVLITLAAFSWGMSLVIARGVHETIPPVGLSFWRWFTGAMVLAPFVLPTVVRKWEVIRRHWKFLLLMGALQTGPSTTMVVGVSFTTAINATVLNASQPAVTALIAWLVIRDKVSTGQSLGIMCGFAGIFFIVFRGELAALAAFQFNIGDILALCAVMGWAVYAVLVGKLPRELGTATTLFLILFSGSFVMLPLYVAETIIIKPVPYGLLTVQTVLTLAIIVSVMSIFIWNAGVRAIGPTRASIFLNLIPISGAILSILFLDEGLAGFHFVGFGFVALGIFLVINRAR